ncbi:MAG TPA: long-chain-fatty-acid--CoA ligase [Pseudonocardia sp.]|jgi:acyl-CoA synthetase (AMP-forming)/AMP-acid ligase II|nr:long-chain-fatty-acid--CoA ligase [Pseudonocardia sp.]
MYLTQGLHRAVAQTPDLPATVFGDRERSWSQSGDRVARLAGALLELGVESGDRVGILSLNSDIYHEFLLAVPWADAVAVPANTRWSAAEIAFSLRDSDTAVLVVDDAFAPMVESLRAEAPVLRTVIHAGTGPAPEGALDLEQLIAEHAPVPDVRRGGDALAAIYYTGGTTGQPKGVMLSHANLLTSALGAAASGSFMTPGGRYLHAAPMFHLADGAAWAARTALGGTHVMVSQFTPVGVAEAIERYQVTDVLLVPTMLQMLVDSPDTADVDLSSVRHLLYGASPISEALQDRVVKRLPSAELTQAYGMTELSPVATLLPAADHRIDRLRRSAGRAAPHAEVRIFDEEDREVPVGTVGEIVCRGGHVMLGYWNRPEETEAALRGGWMHTGDGGYLDDEGYLYVVDRIKDMIVSGGENVYSAEVENALARHPAVASCAVIGVPDDNWGERVHAVVIVAPGADQPSADELREFVKAAIAGYKAPRTVEFVDSMPLSGAGKVLKRELRAQYWSGSDRGVS